MLSTSSASRELDRFFTRYIYKNYLGKIGNIIADVIVVFIFQAQGLLGSASVDKTAGTLLYNMVTRLKDTNRLSFLTEYIITQKITSELQLSGIQIVFSLLSLRSFFNMLSFLNT